MVAAINPITIADTYREHIGAWLEEMSDGLSPGRFRFCKTRSFVPTVGKKGQVTTCFAMKSAWHIGLWQNWSPEVRDGCIEFIKSFQTCDGNFVDEWLLKRIGWSKRIALMKRGRLKEMFRQMFIDTEPAKVRAVRAETRQSAATLIMVGNRPVYPLPVAWQSESAVREFVQSLDWSQPWSAGSHASHLVSFIVMNSQASGEHTIESQMLEAAFEETDRFLDERTGSWGIGEVSHIQRINGAMKVLTAYDWAKRPIPYPERLIDYVLDNTSGDDGCGVLDKIFVLHGASRMVPGYRTSDLEKICLDALNEISEYHQKDGGFSFYPNRAQWTYYDAPVSLGEKQSDMHGAVMFTWACAIALDLLNVREEIGWHISSP